MKKNKDIHRIELLGKNAYFISDAHLGSPNYLSSREREDRIICFLNEIKANCGALFLLGDIFDYWFEYKTVVPKGYVRLLGKLCEFSDQGIDVYFFHGNHDHWLKNYFSQEMGIKVLAHEAAFNINSFKFFIGHGDGLGPGDLGYKFIKSLFANPICTFLFGSLHPDWASKLAGFFSYKSRQADQGREDKEIYESKKNKNLLIYIEEKLKEESFDFFIFAHRHYPQIIDLEIINDKNEQIKAKYANTGDWLNYDSFACFDGKQLSVCKYIPNKSQTLFV